MNAQAAALCPDARVLGAENLLGVCAHLTGNQHLTEAICNRNESPVDYPDLLDVRGQQQAKRGLMTAAAGAHHLIFYGPPGTGKTMLASRLPGILPEMNDQEALEVAAIHTLSSYSQPPSWKQRPFRNPHHTASAVALVGGGSQPRPGEISFAHNGVLFLDELPEFQKVALEVLREPLETREVVISPGQRSGQLPCRLSVNCRYEPLPLWISWRSTESLPVFCRAGQAL